MLVNPAIKEWFDALQGRQPGAGGSAPRGRALPDYGSEVLGGIVKPGTGMFGFNAPAISGRYQPRAPLQSPGERGKMGIPPVAPSASGAGARSIDKGGATVAAGIQKLGQGIEGAMGDYAAKRQAAAAAAAGRPNTPSQFLTPTQPAGGGGDVAPSRPAGGGAPLVPETFPPVGAPATLPLQAQTGAGIGETGTAIGPEGSLPILAQGGGAAVGSGLNVNQFLTGLKAGEGVPYSGYSPTGATGAYGLTGAFIKQWAPSAGLPTERASYAGNAELQDKLAAYAATKMHDKYGSWEKVANAWLTGSPTATVSSPGNMSPAAYDAKVMAAANAAQPGASPLNLPSSAAYAAAAPSLTGSDVPQVAGPGAPELAPPAGNGQSVTPGQGDPHRPGFDPGSVPFINTPPPNGNDQGGAATVPVPPPPGQEQPSWMINGGKPGVYSMPGQQGMNDQMNPLAAALAQGGAQSAPPIDQSALLALALSQGNQPDFGDFGGFFG